LFDCIKDIHAIVVALFWNRFCKEFTGGDGVVVLVAEVVTAGQTNPGSDSTSLRIPPAVAERNYELSDKLSIGMLQDRKIT